MNIYFGKNLVKLNPVHKREGGYMKAHAWFMVGLVTLIGHLSLSAHAHAGPAKTDKCEAVLAPNGDLLKPQAVNAEGIRVFSGWTATGLKRLKGAMTAVKHNYAVGTQIFEAAETPLMVDMMAPIVNANVLRTGGPGGNKTGQTVWLFGAQPDFYKIQLHDSTLPGQLVGNMTEEALKAGRSDLNTKGKLTDPEIHRGLIDEVNNGSPLVIGSLLSLMNPSERLYREGDREYRNPNLDALYFTGNATLYEMLANFERSMMQSGPAFLNRITYKMKIRNWLTPAQQDRRDAVIRRFRSLKADSQYGSVKDREEAARELEASTSQAIDYAAVKVFAEKFFVADIALENAARDFANKARAALAKEMAASEQRLKDDPNSQSGLFVPGPEWTERFRESILASIKASVALEYLIKMDERDLELNKPIKLSILSLWRAFYSAVSIPGGLTRFNPKALAEDSSDALVQFALQKDSGGQYQPLAESTLIEHAKNAREKQEIEDGAKEIQIFNDILRQIVRGSRESAKVIAIQLGQTDQVLLDSVDVELRLSKKGN